MTVIPASLRFLAFCAMLLAAAAPRAAAQGWEWQNPSPHGLAINDVLMVDETHAAAVCAGGYFMHSYDGGATWETRNLGNTDLAAIANPSGYTLIALAMDGTILRSADFGWVWDTTAHGMSDLPNYPPQLARAGDGTMLALYGDLFFRVSRDDGVTWQAVASPAMMFNECSIVAMQARDTWYAGTENAVYRTSDAGMSWQVDSTIAARGLQRLVFIDSLYGYQLRRGQLLRTRDGGASWKEMDVFGFGSNIGLAAGPRLGRSVFALASGEYIVNKSSDEGETWNISLAGNAFPDALPSAIAFASERVGLVAGEGGRMLRTENGGVSWSIVHGLGYIGYVSNLDFSGPRNGIACTASHSVLVTSNGGRRWDEVQPDPDYYLLDVSLRDAEAYAIAYDATYHYMAFHSSDLGRSWTRRSALPVTADAFSVSPHSILALSRDTLWVGASEGTAFRSTDGGVTWDSLTVSAQMRNDYYSGTRIFAFPPQTLIYVSSSGLGVSTDAGDTWAFRRRPDNASMSDTQFLTADLGFALSFNGVIKTTDAGRNWTRLGPTPGFELFRVFDEQRAVGYAVPSIYDLPASLWTSTDGCATWTERPLRERALWQGWCWISPDEGWVYGAGGMLRHTGNGGVAHAEPAATSGEGIACELYPSPYRAATGGALSLRFTLPAGGPRRVRIEIWSALGQRVATVLDDVLAPGAHAAAFRPGAPLPPGAYLCRITAGAQQRTRTFVVLR